jgi:hypothetical protein
VRGGRGAWRTIDQTGGIGSITRQPIGIRQKRAIIVAMGEKRDLVAEMVEAELRAEQVRSDERPTKPPKETFARVSIGEDATIAAAPAAKKARARRVIERVMVKRDPRRDESDPPPPASSSDPHNAVTKPPPPGYGPGQTE